jgi:beta-lactam-binding protein with PASTA domain
VADGGEAWVSNTRIYLNNVGVQPVGTGKIHSYCNNQVAGNATDGGFTDDLCAGAQVTYCTVPKLRKKTVAQATTALTAAGCTIGKVKKQHATKHKKGKVLEQAVPAGIQVKRGTPVAITIGK